jgi:hypothetical protein
LNLALMLCAHVHALHHNTLFIWQNLDHFAAFSLVLKAAADDLYLIILTNSYFHLITPTLSPKVLLAQAR